MIRQLRYVLAIWLISSLALMVAAEDEPQVYTFESGLQFTIPAEGVLDDSGSLPVITLADVALIDVVDPTVLEQTPSATVDMSLTEVLDYLLPAVGFEGTRTDDETISLSLIDGREALVYEFTNATDDYQLVFVLRLSDGRVGALNIRALESLPQEQITAVGELANSFDMPAESDTPSLSDAEAKLVAGLTQEFTYESGVTFRYPEDFIIVDVDDPPVTIGIDGEFIMTMVDPQMVGMPASETMENIIEFVAIESSTISPDDFEPFDIGGREAVFAVIDGGDVYIAMALVRFSDETTGIMDMLMIAEPTDEQIGIIRSVAASFNSADTEVGITRADIDEAQALFDESTTARDEGDNEGVVDLLTQAIDIDPDFGLAYYRRSLAYEQLGQLEDAVADLRQVIELEPDEVQVRSNLADTYALLGDIDAAVAELELYIEAVGEDKVEPVTLRTYEAFQAVVDGEYSEDFYYYRARQLRAYGLYEEALASNQVVLENSPDDARFYAQRGVIYINMEDYEEAISTFTEGLEIEIVPILFYNRGFAYRENSLNDLNAMINGVHDFQCLLLLADDSITEEEIAFAERSITMTFISSDDYEPITDPADCQA